MNDKVDTSNYNTRVYCNRCGRETNHVCKGEHRHEYTELDGPGGRPTGWWHRNIYRLLICAGCETATLEESYTDVSHYDPEQDDDFYYQISYSPQRKHGSQRVKRFRQLPKKLDQIYSEAVQAYNATLHVLCAVGLRALIEGICTDKGIKGRNLQERIDALEGLLPKNIVENLHNFRFMGNEAVHELTAPGDTELRLAIEVCEDLLNYLYDLDYKTSRLAIARKRRKKQEDAP